MKRNHLPMITGDLVPRTGARDPDPGRLAAAVTAGETFGTARVPHPAHLRTIAAFDRTRLIGLATGSGRKPLIAALGKSGSGKTTTMATFAAQTAAGRPDIDGQPARPVVIIPLDNGCTNRRLWGLVLEGHDDPPGRGTEETFRARAYVTMRRAGTEMLVFDEVQHLVRSPNARDVTDTIKRILDDGVVTLGIVGTDEALPLIQKNIQLANRMLAPAHIVPLDFTKDADRLDFGTFLAKLDAFVVSNDILPERSGLEDDRVIRCLFVVCQGVVGVAVNLIRQAVVHAVERGAKRIETYDMSAVVDAWAIPTGVCEANPFPMVFTGRQG